MKASLFGWPSFARMLRKKLIFGEERLQLKNAEQSPGKTCVSLPAAQ